mgnify:FL=1
MVNILRNLNKFYGNRKLLFDILLAVVITLASFFLVNKFNLILNINPALLYSLTQFLGVLAGFLLTAFSLLYLYNPTESKTLTKLKKHSLFVRMLKSFLSAIILTILSIIFIYLNISLSTYLVSCNYILFFILILTFLRIIKCIYYLFVIIDIGNASINTTS